jgi:tRNA nucleotidyltransferase (CCA-adding enzyme)
VLLQRPPLAIGDLAVSGSDLKSIGLEPGPRFGEVLRALLERVIEHPEMNTREQLLALVRTELDP